MKIVFLASRKGTLYYIYFDLWGLSRVPSKGNGSREMLTFINDFSQKVWVFFFKEKKERYLLYLSNGRS
jgi:hypothetical protein